MRLDCVERLDGVPAAAWDALVGADNPFVCHAFLSALERSGSVGSEASGWRPRHLLVHAEGQLVAAMPVYEKAHSYGEYIFDWAWAEAAERAGLSYYPKLVAAVPFTPATGPRMLLHPAAVADPRLVPTLLQGLRGLAEATQASSIHVLFCTEVEAVRLGEAGLTARLSYQFHWQAQPSWRHFDDFLAALRAPARKQVRRERATAAAHGLRLCMQRGTELNARAWAALESFYRSTVADKRAYAYLPSAFFTEARRSLAPQVLAAMAYDDDEPVAGALFFTRGSHLYGRYWGAHRHYDALHFELCYYQPIAWALTHGIRHFEAGAQGEHKLKRGLLPAACHSAHWLRHPGLAQAVNQAIAGERRALLDEMAGLSAHTPYPRPPQTT